MYACRRLADTGRTQVGACTPVLMYPSRVASIRSARTACAAVPHGPARIVCEHAGPQPGHGHWGSANHLCARRCIGARGDWCGDYYTQPLQRVPLPPLWHKPCPNNCSGIGMCNHMTGLCDCPAGVAYNADTRWRGLAWLGGCMRLSHASNGVQCGAAPHTRTPPAGTASGALSRVRRLHAHDPLPTGAQGSDCSQPHKRPCTNRVGGYSTPDKKPFSHIGPDMRDLNITAPGWTASRCVGICDDDLAACYCDHPE
jgi:hypothetical protein